MTTGKGLWRDLKKHESLKGCLCARGTGEVVHVMAFKAAPGQLDRFEAVVQNACRSLHEMEVGITDVRVCHPCAGEVVFVITFLSREEQAVFVAGPEKCLLEQLGKLSENKSPTFSTAGTLMPPAHTLTSLIKYLKTAITGDSHTAHDVQAVGNELAKWFPRPEEYMKYVHWDNVNPQKYTRNLIFANEYMDVLLMCWPPHSESAIHGHDKSSCWVSIVEGSVHEVQFAVPTVDKRFIQQQMRDPTGAVGRCGKLTITNVARLDAGGVTSTYANNDIGVHRIENRTDHPAYTLHIYAPGLRKIKIFKDCGTVCVHTVGALSLMSEKGEKTGKWNSSTNPDGVLDVDAWNNYNENDL
eukprot:g4151.t1